LTEKGKGKRALVRSCSPLSSRHTARAATTEAPRSRAGPIHGGPALAPARPASPPGVVSHGATCSTARAVCLSPFPSPSEAPNIKTLFLPRPALSIWGASLEQGPTHLQPLAGAPPPPTTSISLAAGAQSSLREDEDACWLLLTGVAMGYERIHKVQVTDELSSAA
jgi:hypothetical protein